MKVGKSVKSEGELIISGTNGCIYVPSPWWKTDYFEVHYEQAEKVDKYSETFLGDGLRYEISDLLALINQTEKNDFKLTRGESVALAGIMEQFIKENRS